MNDLTKQLMSTCKDQGVDISSEQAEALIEEKSAELTDEELDMISGGEWTEDEVKEFLLKLIRPFLPR